MPVLNKAVGTKGRTLGNFLLSDIVMHFLGHKKLAEMVKLTNENT